MAGGTKRNLSPFYESNKSLIRERRVSRERLEKARRAMRNETETFSSHVFTAFTFTSKGVYSSPSSVGSVGSAAGETRDKKRLVVRRSGGRVGGG